MYLFVALCKHAHMSSVEGQPSHLLLFFCMRAMLLLSHSLSRMCDAMMYMYTRRSSEHWAYVVGLGLPLCVLYVVMVPAFVYRILSSPDNLAKVASAHANTRDVFAAHVHMSRTCTF